MNQPVIELTSEHIFYFTLLAFSLCSNSILYQQAKDPQFNPGGDINPLRLRPEGHPAYKLCQIKHAVLR